MSKLLLSARSKKDIFKIRKLTTKYTKIKDNKIIEKIISIVINTTAQYKVYGLGGINYLGNIITIIINILGDSFKMLAAYLQMQFTNFIINY